MIVQSLGLQSSGSLEEKNFVISGDLNRISAAMTVFEGTSSNYPWPPSPNAVIRILCRCTDALQYEFLRVAANNRKEEPATASACRR